MVRLPTNTSLDHHRDPGCYIDPTGFNVKRQSNAAFQAPDGLGDRFGQFAVNGNTILVTTQPAWILQISPIHLVTMSARSTLRRSICDGFNAVSPPRARSTISGNLDQV